MRTILDVHDNPALREISRDIPLDEIRSEKIRGLIAEMKTLLSKEKYGVALAASQVGEPIKIFIVSGAALAKRTEYEEESAPTVPDQVYINAELVKVSRGKSNKHEGCLSIRGLWGEVPRAEKATVRAYDEEGRPFTRGASGFLAHIFQHEIDHLNGILYTDKAVKLHDDEPNDE